MSDPKGFLKSGRKDPSKRPAEERTKDWKEFTLPFPEPVLKQQATRCMDCGVPFCQSGTGCPVENLIPDWNDWVSQGRWEEALESLHSTNNFPEFTGKLCPAPCETACVLGISDDPVTIRAIESSIIDRGFESGWVKPLVAAEKSGKKIAVVGSGPAGLAAAQQLAREGHSVTVFEKADRVGGLLRYGIPDFKMEKGILDRRLAQLSAEGVEFRTGVCVGKDISLSKLRESHAAVCLTIGAEGPRDLQVPGRELGGIHFAMDYLIQQNRAVSGLPLAGERISAEGKRVAILGGGDTGSDCLGTAHRQGCQEVFQFEILSRPPDSRGGSTPWPLWPMKLRSSHAHEEGGERRWGVSTTGFRGKDGKVTHLLLTEVELKDGVLSPKAGTETEIVVDLVILAMGFTTPILGALNIEKKLKTDARGNIVVDAFYATSLPGVFAAGDAKRGASLIVWAIAEGRKMAAAVHAELTLAKPASGASR